MNQRFIYTNVFLKAGLFALLCGFMLNIAAWGIQTYNSFSQTTVADAAITVKTIETCHHHPHGCPKDCLCPKTHVTSNVQKMDPLSSSGVIRVPTLVACTEQGSSNTSPSFSIFISEPKCVLPLVTKVAPLRVFGSEYLPNPPGKLPQKIPIA